MVDFKTYHNLIMHGIGSNFVNVFNNLKDDGVSDDDINSLVVGLYENFLDNAPDDVQGLAIKIDKQLQNNEKIENSELAKLSGTIGALAYDTFSHGY